MPDEKGELTATELKKAIAFLKEKLKVKTCPLCGEEDLGLSDYIGGIPMAGASGLVTSRYTPCIVTVCNNCGYIRSFAAVKAGIIPPQESQGTNP